VKTNPGTDESLLVAGARDFARAELLEADRRWDKGQGSVADVVPKLAEMGFLNITLDEEVGGLGCDYVNYSRILHEIAYASPSAAVTVSVHNMVGEILAKFASHASRTGLLESWGQAASLGSFAISEAAAGSDPGASRTRAHLSGDAYVVNGEKLWISNGLTGRWFVTLARTGDGPDGELSMLLVDGESDGLSRTPIHGKMGIRGSETAAIGYSDVRVPVENLLGEPGDGLQVSFSALNGGRIGIGAQATGIAEACLDEMVAYAREREQFDRPIGYFQAIQNMVADSAVELAAARALIERAASFMDRGIVMPAASAQAKLYATEAANRIAYRAVQVFGGSGYVNDYRVDQLYRDARVTTIYEGTSEIQRIVIARDLLGRN